MILMFNFDTSSLTKRFKEGLNKARLKSALFEVGSQIVNDAVTKPPTPRIDTGALRGSWSIAVGGKLVLTGNPKVKPEINNMGEIELRVGFNTPYAAIMESGKRKGKKIEFGVKSLAATPRTGDHFLETKLKNKERVYLKFLHDRL